MSKKMNRDKKKRTAERFLNYALEIIYLLTGEEYTIVKKNSPHSSIHQLTGEVPIKCDDVAVYFSMEEWEYIEENKELYKDMMMKSSQTFETSGVSEDRSSETVSSCDEGVVEKDGDDIQRVEICSDRDIGQHDEKIDLILSIEEDEVETDNMNMAQSEIKSEPYTVKSDVVMAKQTEEDPCARTQLEDPEQEMCDNISTGHSDGYVDVVSINEEEDDDRDELNIHMVEIKSEPSADHYFSTYGSMNSDTLEEFHTVDGDNLSLSQEFLGNDGRMSPRASTSSIKGNLPSLAHYHGQPMCHSDLMRREMQMYNRNYAPNLNITSDFISPPEIPVAEEYYPCDKCEKVFSSPSSLYGHQRMHNEDKPNRCNECGKHFSKKGNLVVHQRLHTGEKPFRCNECNKSFSSKSSLLVHEKMHTGEKPHMCNDCGKYFAHKYYLLIHQRSHTGEKPYSCNECQRHFTYKSSLLAHQKAHTGEKPHECPVCGKHFAKKSNLDVHKRSHTGEKLYSCNECGKHFAYRSQLITHKRSHIKEDPSDSPFPWQNV